MLDKAIAFPAPDQVLKQVGFLSSVECCVIGLPTNKCEKFIAVGLYKPALLSRTKLILCSIRQYQSYTYIQSGTPIAEKTNQIPPYTSTNPRPLSDKNYLSRTPRPKQSCKDQ